MGAENRKSKRKLSARRSEGTITMAKTKAQTSSGSSQSALGLSNSSVLALISLVLCVGSFVAFGFGRGHGSLPRSGRPQEVIQEEKLRVFGYEIVEEFPHDPGAFTQGLFYDGNDTFYESTGLYGKSSVRKVDMRTGKVLQQRQMNQSLFGEGLTLWGSRLLQVTWLTKKGVIYDKRTLQIVGSFDHPMGDGWGLTSDDKHIVGSDGTATLYFMDPDTFREVRNVTVRDEGRPIKWLNELEYIRDEIWANVYQTECIARIAPKDGRVTGWLLMHGLKRALIDQGVKEPVKLVQELILVIIMLEKLKVLGVQASGRFNSYMLCQLSFGRKIYKDEIHLHVVILHSSQVCQNAHHQHMDVLNGIAWDSQLDRLFVTGKQWPKVYEIKLIDHTSRYTDLGAIRRACIY